MGTYILVKWKTQTNKKPKAKQKKPQKSTNQKKPQSPKNQIQNQSNLKHQKHKHWLLTKLKPRAKQIKKTLSSTRTTSNTSYDNTREKAWVLEKQEHHQKGLSDLPAQAFQLSLLKLPSHV